jgi:hypothetical protein
MGQTFFLIPVSAETLFPFGKAKSSHLFCLATLLRCLGVGGVRRSSLFCKVGRLLEMLCGWQEVGKRVKEVVSDTPYKVE